MGFIDVIIILISGYYTCSSVIRRCRFNGIFLCFQHSDISYIVLCMFSVSWDVTNLMMMVQGTKKTLILQEMPEDGVKVLSYKEYMATCDVALFVYDSSVEHSWKRTKELLVEVARQGEVSGHGVPCLLIAAKDDLDPCQITVSQEVGIEPPIRGLPLTIVGLAAYQAYATWRNSKCQERKLCLAVNFKRVVGLWPLINCILLALRSP
ncbi:hypothetical protein Patl1_32904 [Pistacia atlantica]|uniref:Uncharacterized protein n=1 Tax=Pistacia atlantica TaxID=434234 RepID=A0ACC1AMH0_9ROSI|nr:hypothetical protein Patl1_32904 [Pistacia atlantica]